MKLLTKQEELVLLTIRNLEDNAYLISIRKHLTGVTGKEWSVGAVYVPLERLRNMGYVHSHIGEPTAERGGRGKKFYIITHDGIKALVEAKRVNDLLWGDRGELAFE